MLGQAGRAARNAIFGSEGKMSVFVFAWQMSPVTGTFFLHLPPPISAFFAARFVTINQSHILFDDRDLEPIDIYGPEGTRDFVRSVIQLSYSKITVPHRIHELKEVPFLHGQYTEQTIPPTIRTQVGTRFGERPGNYYLNVRCYADIMSTMVRTHLRLKHKHLCLAYSLLLRHRRSSKKIVMFFKTFMHRAAYFYFQGVQISTPMPTGIIKCVPLDRTRPGYRPLRCSTAFRAWGTSLRRASNRGH
jgi:hypothetical protein